MTTTAAGARRRERRPLPCQVRLVQNETTLSLIQRLAQANHIRADHLAGYLNARASTSGRYITVAPQVLADAAGIDASHLIRALPQLRPRPAGRGENPADITDAEARLACRCCMAAKNIFSAVTVLAWTDRNVCLRHQLWTGHGVTIIGDQADVTRMPEVSRAQTRHLRLARNHGLRSVRDCYATAENIIDWSTSNPSSLTARQERIQRLMAASSTGALRRSYDYASYYPEVVSVLSVLASAHWQRMARSADPDDTLRFYRQVAANGLTNGTPRYNTPLRNWIAELRAEPRLGSG